MTLPPAAARPGTAIPDRDELILLTGATGHIGGRLLRRLQEADRPLRCLTRRPDDLLSQIAGRTEIAKGDVLDPESLAVAMRGVQTAYYLVHSMGATGDFKALDRRAAANFADAARDARVARIIYLGGLGSGDDLSEHLASRHEVGRILRSSGVPTIGSRLDRNRHGQRLVRGHARDRRTPSGDPGPKMG